MEDGDDDISLTADGQKWKDDQVSSENDTVVTKDEKGLPPGEQYLIPSSSPRKDNPYVVAPKFDDKEDSSDQESENKTFSSDTNPVDNSSEHLDENCDEFHNVERSEPSPIPVPSKQPSLSEANDRIDSQDDFSEPHENQSEQLCSGEGNTFSSVEEAENVHSAVGEEEQEEEEEEEAVEEEEEEEDDLQTSASSNELVSKLSESYLQDENLKAFDHPKENDDEDIKTSDHENEEYDDGKTSDHENEEYDDDKTSDHENEEYDDGKTSDHENEEYDDGKTSDHENEEYDDGHIKTPEHLEEEEEECDDENLQKSDSPNQYSEENLKTLDDTDDDDDDDDDDGNMKTSEQSNEEFSDERFKNYDYSDRNDENLKSPDHPDAGYNDENLKKSDSLNEHNENFETNQPNDDVNDNNVKTFDHPSEEFSDENIKMYGNRIDVDEDETPDYPIEQFVDETLKISDTSFEENDDENFQKSDLPSRASEEECNTEQERRGSGSLGDIDLQHEMSEDENISQEERVLIEERERLSPNKNDKGTCNAEGDTFCAEECAQNDNNHDEYVTPDDRNLVTGVSAIDTVQQKRHDDISSTKEESCWMGVDDAAGPQVFHETEEDLVSESECTDEQVHLKEDCGPNENEQQNKCKENKIIEFEDHETEVEQHSLVNNARSIVSDSDPVEFSVSEKVTTEQCDETRSREEENVVLCSSDNKEGEPPSESTLNPLEKSSETKETICVKMDEEETVSEINEQDFEMQEVGSPERSDANSMLVCKKVSTLPCVQECSPLKEGEHEVMNDDDDDDDDLCVNEESNAEKVDETENVVKVNGEVELINSNLLSCKETIVSAKEKVGLKRKLQTSPTHEISCDVSPPDSVKGNIQFKGFKKRYIAQVSEVSSKESPDVSPSVQEELRIKNKRASKKLVLETPQVLVSHQPLPDVAQANTPLTEYAQYLGLQPTVKFKCYNCGESGFPSMLKLQEHQNVCLKNIRIHTYTKPPPSPIVEPAPSTNFRITRKVYLCSACGTYYENWNLFLHMREVHKRHICLFCLLMFSQADKLAQHLSAKHRIPDCSYNTPAQFLNEFKGSFFVMCCTCEQMFSERDHFFEHLCKDTSVVNTDQACSLCGLKGAHFPTCRRAFTDSSLASPSQNNSQTAIVNTSTDTSQNSQLNMQEKPLSASKYSVQTDKSTTGRKSLHKLSDQNHDRPDKSHHAGDLDDDYDISDAASYCHVNIHEPDKQKAASPNENTDNNDASNDEANVDSEKMDDEEQRNEENQNATYITEETAKENSANKINNDRKNETDDLISPDETQMEVDRQSPQPMEVNDEENRQMEVDEKPGTPPRFSLSTNDGKQSDVHMDPQSINELKSPKGGDSESDSSVSGAESHDSDGSSSSSEASSDENEPEEKEPQKTVKSDESDVDKSDSDKMSIVVDEARSEDDEEKPEAANDDIHSNASENETNEVNEHKNDSPEESDVKLAEKPANNTDFGEEQQDNIQIAGDDVPLLELTLEETLDALSIQTVVKECVKISCSTCVYCNHAKKIAVNGKQLVLHLLAEHRFEPVVCSDSGELTPVFGFVDNLKSKLSELQDMYFNTDTYDSADKSFTRPYDRTYECFHCHFITTLHKELYVHNRKMHQKTILLCIMCKSNFYSYSELLCHLCPGIYVPDSNILFRCCLCIVDGLPSAFRLMVHLRKRHHACDVCLETTGDQQKLSNHVWKHKLHHLCYRCGIAYRNKPDITKHLFWKHGTESVLCKKCLQKKWPHVYHFCIPPTAFLCEECNASFSRAVALKVHKRLHADDIPYQCDECEDRFISKKLLRRHKEKHKQVIAEKEAYKNGDKVDEKEMTELEQSDKKPHSAVTENDDVDKDIKEENSEHAVEKSTVRADTSGGSEAPGEISKESDEIHSNKLSEETKSDKKSKVVDVYDLPPLNLSSESDDSDEEQIRKQPVKDSESEDTAKLVLNENAGETLKSQDGEPPTEEEVQPVQIVDGVWDNFKTYKANLEKREILQAQASGNLVASSSTSLVDNSVENHAIVDIVMADHDYCVLPEKPNEDKNTHLNVSSAQELLNIEATDAAENLDDKGGGFGADHNYCFNTSPQSEDKKELSVSLPQNPTDPSLHSPPLPVSHPSLPTPPPPTPPSSLTSSPKKKQKSPKKKQKQSGSSSSSDSSSNSDSSSCTCGTNCSCSSSSSSSSGSSSSSSDSDSSSSEGRRRQAARRERRRERAKRKMETGSRGGTPPPAVGLSTPGTEAGDGLATLEATQTPAQIDSSGAGSLQVDDTPVTAAPEPEENEFLIRESDLDTTETETDEDFYDKYPQRQANKLLAEKRNQLLLLAAVAPVNNGTIAQPSPPPPPEVQEPVQKKKGKTKRHKKAQHNSSEKKVESKLKLNIPVSYYNSPSFSVGNAVVSPVINSQNPTSSHVPRLHHDTFSPINPEASSTPTAYHSTGSGSETESKRLSKRKRIPKKFYGDSSDEEAEHTPHQPYKWRKVTPASSSTPQVQPTISSGFGYRGVSVNVPPPEPVHVQPLPAPEKSDDEDGDESDSGHEEKRSSSDSSNSDSDNEQSDADSDVETLTTVTNAVSAVSGNATQQKNENLYCYCQCPYDEVSEMIACDGKDCSIEWFHFECVGIMVPPKGKWFCPDCRKKTAARSEYLLHA